MKWVLIIQGGQYEDAWEKCVGVYDTKESAEQVQVKLQEVLNHNHLKQYHDFCDADWCYVEEVEENLDINSIIIKYWSLGKEKGE